MPNSDLQFTVAVSQKLIPLVLMTKLNSGLPKMTKEKLTDAEQRVATALAAHALPANVIILEQLATTAQMAAEALDVTVGQIVKSLCFKGADSGAAYLILVSGDNRVHEKRLGRQLGEKLIRADADFVKQYTGFSIGGVSPFGHATTMRMVFDEHLLTFDTIWAAAGNPRSVFEIKPEDLLRTTGAQRLIVT